MNTISDIMFWISNGLLVPVVVLLILLFSVLCYWWEISLASMFLFVRRIN